MISNRADGIVDGARQVVWVMNAIGEVLSINDGNQRYFNVHAGEYQIVIYLTILIYDVVVAVLRWMRQWIIRGGAALGLWRAEVQLEEGKQVEVIFSAGIIV